jgi:hypothetical protein
MDRPAPETADLDSGTEPRRQQPLLLLLLLTSHAHGPPLRPPSHLHYDLRGWVRSTGRARGAGWFVRDGAGVGGRGGRKVRGGWW